SAGDLADQQGVARIVNDWPVLLVRQGEAVHALINRCTHAASALDGGRVRRGTIICPLHGARFQIATGKCLGGQNYKDLTVFSVRETADGWVEVAVPDEKPGPEHLPVRSSPA
ncbi:MAG: Rieske (2Fe-2S) protein, partial [Alphaproteobacteria bacterium]